jgi:hypothetical protein
LNLLSKSEGLLAPEMRGSYRCPRRTMNFWPGPAPRFIFTPKDIQVLEGLLEILNITYYKPVRRTRTGAGIFFSTTWCFGPRYLQYTYFQ